MKGAIRTKLTRRNRPPNGYDCVTVRARSKQLVSRLMDSFCGCCGRPSVGLWCRQCEGHIGRSGKLCERTYQAVKGRPCPFQV
jgi:hypothetical protein